MEYSYININNGYEKSYKYMITLLVYSERKIDYKIEDIEELGYIDRDFGYNEKDKSQLIIFLTNEKDLLRKIKIFNNKYKGELVVNASIEGGNSDDKQLYVNVFHNSDDKLKKITTKQRDFILTFGDQTPLTYKDRREMFEEDWDDFYSNSELSRWEQYNQYITEDIFYTDIVFKRSKHELGIIKLDFGDPKSIFRNRKLNNLLK